MIPLPVCGRMGKVCGSGFEENIQSIAAGVLILIFFIGFPFVLLGLVGGGELVTFSLGKGSLLLLRRETGTSNPSRQKKTSFFLVCLIFLNWVSQKNKQRGNRERI
ncbi:hypothetical protein QBC36DRAFT_329605 [Triangularia setosa]|uniref:Uncharacterized protein n=1 Tax=Triangularia setosa TaxID=2587417 RepID=A0AAN6W6K0_9PEZI|nr:hypothetical protein QBC36DRAFT_329605 [Podospora setosa]